MELLQNRTPFSIKISFVVQIIQLDEFKMVNYLLFVFCFSHAAKPNHTNETIEIYYELKSK